jgi:hypothetical protein
LLRIFTYKLDALRANIHAASRAYVYARILKIMRILKT